MGTPLAYPRWAPAIRCSSQL
ncbi:MAG TPA: hypothetical protein EYQ66_08085 [Myxococcales bacterium]|nr:hypothetical protein [Myxococcales bacterium]